MPLCQRSAKYIFGALCNLLMARESWLCSCSRLHLCKRTGATGEASPLMENAKECLLIEKIRSGERELFHDLIRTYERRAFLIAYAILRSNEDAEDVVQQAMLKVFLNLGQLADPEKFPQWAMRIVENDARMCKRKRHQELYESLDSSGNDGEASFRPRQFADWREVPSEIFEQSETRKAILDALDGLPEIYREIFVMRDVEHLNVAETAEVLGISIPVVKTRLHRARLLMREALTPFFASAQHSISIWERWKGINPWFAVKR